MCQCATCRTRRQNGQASKPNWADKVIAMGKVDKAFVYAVNATSPVFTVGEKQFNEPPSPIAERILDIYMEQVVPAWRKA